MPATVSRNTNMKAIYSLLSSSIAYSLSYMLSKVQFSGNYSVPPFGSTLWKTWGKLLHGMGTKKNCWKLYFWKIGLHSYCGHFEPHNWPASPFLWCLGTNVGPPNTRRKVIMVWVFWILHQDHFIALYFPLLLSSFSPFSIF